MADDPTTLNLVMLERGHPDRSTIHASRRWPTRMLAVPVWRCGHDGRAPHDLGIASRVRWPLQSPQHVAES